MRTNRLFLALLVAVLCMCNLSAQKMVLQDSVSYNFLEKATLSYTKNILKELNDKILLPKEVNVLIEAGKDEEIYALPQWDGAYFKHDSIYTTFLIVPLKATYKTSEINMELNVVSDMYSYYRIVNSQFVIENGSASEYISVSSNILGDCVGAHIYGRDNMIEEIIPISRKYITDAIYKMPKSKSSDYKMNDRDIPRVFHTARGNRSSISQQLGKTSRNTYLLRTDSKGRQSARLR